MESIVYFLRELSKERDYHFFYDEGIKHLWVSGRFNGKHFDLVVFPIKKRYIKVVYETADRRLPILFLNEQDALKRIKKIFSATEEAKTKEIEGENIFGFEGYSIERAEG